MSAERSVSAVVLAACLSISAPAKAEDEADLSIQNLLALGKFVGLCGSFTQMARFQESTQLDGGEEFVMRFLLSESARLGQSQEDFLASCAERSEMYNSWYELDLDGQTAETD